jgi:hypothetical protein
MLGADQVLKDSGREPIFTPMIGAGLNKILPKNDLTKWRDNFLTSLKEVNDLRETKETVSDLISQTKGFKSLTIEDRTEYLNLLKEMSNSTDDDLSVAKAKAVDILNSHPKK